MATGVEEIRVVIDNAMVIPYVIQKLEGLGFTVKRIVGLVIYIQGDPDLLPDIKGIQNVTTAAIIQSRVTGYQRTWDETIKWVGITAVGVLIFTAIVVAIKKKKK